MEELAKALAEAVRVGTAIAPSTIIGYYSVRIAEALAAPAAFVAVAWIIGHTVRRCVLRYADIDEKNPARIRDAY